MHVEVPKNKRKKIDQTLNAFFPYVDSVDINAARIITASLEYDGKIYECATEWKQVKAECGPISLMTLGAIKSMVSSRDKESMTMTPPYNSAYPFTIAKVGGEIFALASRYALHSRFHPFFFKDSDPNWLSASNVDSIKECANWKTLKSDPLFRSLVVAGGRYFGGDIVCIRNVECKDDVSVTTLSVSMSLVPTKYLPTLRSIASANDDGHEWEEWKTILKKANPLFRRSDIKNATFNITVESQLARYNSIL